MDNEPVWVDAKQDFVEADVVRWTENIWSKKKRGRGKAAKHVLLGKQRVVGQIEDVKNDMVWVKVIEAEVTEAESTMALTKYKLDDVIKKKVSTLKKGEMERLLWSDESVRDGLIAEK